MRKIPTLFQRDPDDRAHVLPVVQPDCQWVIDGEGAATRKWDGTCVMYDGHLWWGRREIKPGGHEPATFIALETDPNTSKTVGWESIDRSSFWRYFNEARAKRHDWAPGTYELVGPRVNGNPEQFPTHTLVRHGIHAFPEAPRTYQGLRDFLLERAEIEGVVWHHPDGRMAKVKRRDFA